MNRLEDYLGSPGILPALSLLGLLAAPGLIGMLIYWLAQR